MELFDKFFQVYTTTIDNRLIYYQATFKGSKWEWIYNDNFQWHQGGRNARINAEQHSRFGTDRIIKQFMLIGNQTSKKRGKIK